MEASGQYKRRKGKHGKKGDVQTLSLEMLAAKM
jgi:hypothetical protein